MTLGHLLPFLVLVVMFYLSGFINGQLIPCRVRDERAMFEPTLLNWDSVIGRGLHTLSLRERESVHRKPTWLARFNNAFRTAHAGDFLFPYPSDVAARQDQQPAMLLASQGPPFL
jgi:hypothetical protein